ncbi:hypothetical protein BCR41DRAFT_402648 [Lobosporangium transversale]|uniref:Uncharacterized protein n=1 Tax=Lobosporangium transversale TaxID=64571 RepID=A0A1Y2G119_9FUNG|nr:hypothetical protein BCR41DRAFT_402648 [Lobosporangium transversale]ORY90324.1 hypothetical protein BCR41DRAFT_402648 [Lobosporangium transversale]|eukprot:XP_021875094.1 hypothetical protein BCR41DRAFT_402648 [Lobosporangium transversale]
MHGGMSEGNERNKLIKHTSEVIEDSLLDDVDEIDRADDLEEFDSDCEHGSEESDSDRDSWNVDYNDYSSGASDSDPEIEPESSAAPVEAISIHPSADFGTGESSLMPGGSESPELDESVIANANEIATEILCSEVHDYQWIKSTLDDETIKDIVNDSRTEPYDYLPRIFYVNEEDFSAWLEQDSLDHYFVWMRRVHRDNKADGRSKYFYFQTHECHRNHDSRGQNRVQTAQQDSPQDSSQDSPQDPGQEQGGASLRRAKKLDVEQSF